MSPRTTPRAKCLHVQEQLAEEATQVSLRWLQKLMVAPTYGPQNSRAHRTGLARTEANIEKVLEMMQVANNRASARSIAAEMDISHSSVHRILRKELKLFTYKPIRAQLLKPEHKSNRVDFSSPSTTSQSPFLPALQLTATTSSCIKNVSPSTSVCTHD